MPARSRELAALGEALRRERQRQGRTQQAVADDAGVRREYLASAELGERNPAYATLTRIAGGLGVPLSQLVADGERLLSD